MTEQRLTAILPCNDLDASEAFYNRLGFFQDAVSRDAHDGYRILADGEGGHLHLTEAVEGWLVKGRNPFALYLYIEDVDAMAAVFSDAIIEPEKRASHKPWGMYEFALSDPDDTLVRVGWSSRLVGDR